MSRNRGRIGVGLVLALAAGMTPGVAATPAFEPPCTSFAASPTFATDRTAACTYTVEDNEVYLLRFALTSDAGRSWRLLPATGLTTKGSQISSFVPSFSPAFATDRTIMVSTDNGLHVSRDAGQTWTLVDPIVRSGTRQNPAPFFAPPLAPLPGFESRLYAAFATGDARTARIDLELGVHEPAAGTPGSTAAFVPHLTKSGATEIVALGWTGQPTVNVGTAPGTQYALYRCTLELSCAQPLHAFPPSDSAQIWAAPNGVLVVETIHYIGITDVDVKMWRSTDGGTTFTRWSSVDALLAPSLAAGRSGPRVAVATNPRLPHLMYLRIGTTYTFGLSTSNVPLEQVFRSDNAGQTWRRIGFRRASRQAGPAGTLPFAGPVPGPDTAGLFLTGDGRLFALGLREERFGHGVFCSVDGGRSWRTLCAR